MKNETENLTYAEAISELEQIISEMEESSVDVDILAGKVKRAAILLQFCREKLTSTENEVNDILKNFDKEKDG